jgi:hypothetical protein
MGVLLSAKAMYFTLWQDIHANQGIQDVVELF